MTNTNKKDSAQTKSSLPSLIEFSNFNIQIRDPEALADLLSAQMEIEAVSKDAKNPYFKSDYATLEATIVACRETLNKYGFVILQPIESDSEGVYVCTTLIHKTGGVISSRMRIESKVKNDPQAQGSAITYARRYSLQALLCMNAKDDDGEKAMNRAGKTAASTSVSSDDNQDRCSVCGATGIYHRPDCPNKPNS